MKQCSKCGILKDESEFQKRPESKDGLRNECKKCKATYNHNRYMDNNEEFRANQREWNKNNKEIKKENGSRWYQNNKDRVRECDDKWRKENPAKAKEISKKSAKKYQETHCEEINERAKQWRVDNPELARERSRVASQKIRDTVTGNLNCVISSAIRRTLKGTKSKRHWESLVGYSINQLKEHLENQFDANMSWDNHGKYWEIDHKLPVVSFQFNTTDDEGFRKCWAMDNLQPLIKSHNRRKSAKIGYYEER